MIPSNFNVSSFKGQVFFDGLARTNRFEVDIISPIHLPSTFARKVSLMVSDTSFPPLTVLSKTLRIFGPGHQRPTMADYGGEALPFQFWIDSNMDIKRYFDDWIGLVVDPIYHTVGYQNEYASTVRIKQLNEASQITYAIELLEAFPRSINMLPVSNEDKNGFHRLQVIFSYRRWIRVL